MITACLTRGRARAASPIALALGLALAAPAHGGELAAPIASPDTAGAAYPSANPRDSTASGRVQVVSDRAGTVTAAVWSDHTATADRLVVAIERDGSWGAPTVLSAADSRARGANTTEPVPVRLVVGPNGVAHLLWGSFFRTTGVPRSLTVASNAGAGWVEHRVVRASRKRGLGLTSDLAALSDGTVAVAWSTATRPPSEFSQGKIPPGTLLVTEQRPDGSWQAARRIAPADGISARPTFAVNAAGGAALGWAPASTSDSDDPASTRWSLRTGPGDWSVGGTAKGVSPSLAFLPQFDDAGRLHLLAGGWGLYGLAGMGDWMVGAGQVTPKKPSEMAGPTDEQSLRGWLGTGYLHSVGAALGASGELVVVWGGEPLDVESGGYGTGTIWSAARALDGHWTVSRVDALSTTSGALDVDASTDAAGRVVATWSASEGSCGSVVYRSVRGADGTWAPRTIAAFAGRGPRPADESLNAGRCDAVAPHETGGPAPRAWWIEQAPRRLVVRPVQVVPREMPAASFDVAATTWAQVRAAGGLPIRCASPEPQLTCSASIVESVAGLPRRSGERDVAALNARALGCFNLRATAAITSDTPTLILPRRLGCAHGVAPPTMSFNVLVTAEVPGAPPASQQLPVTLGR